MREGGAAGGRKALFFLPTKFILLSRRMASAATGPLVSFVVLLALPLCGAFFLSAGQFAIWTILSTITTVALSLDFGGVALTSAKFGSVSTIRLLFHASALSALGALLVGAVSALLWIPYSQTEAANAFHMNEGMAAIALSTFAAVCRSALAVLAQAALHLEQPRIRNFLTAGQAFLCFGIAFSMLLLSPSAWALPVGWSISSGLVLVIGLVWMARRALFSDAALLENKAHTSTFTFVWARTAASVLGSAVLQGDRWIVGAIGGAEFLAAYEVAWRIAALPRLLVQNLAVSISSDAARIFWATPRKIKGALSDSMTVSVVVAAASALAIGAGYFFAVDMLGVAQVPTIFLLLLTSFTLVGLTAPLSFVAVAIGLPALDIPYLLLTVVVSGFAGFASFISHDVEVYVMGNSIGIGLGAIWFWYYGFRAVRSRCGIASRRLSTRRFVRSRQ
jgi:nucleotide-binding universal stress UspA family protein